jgi:spore maturation protein CgeB
MPGLRFAFFGSSVVSAYWNGAATYYRGIIRHLHARGHRVTFYEPDAFERQRHRDLEDPPWCQVVVYSGTDEREVWGALDRARGADVLVKASGVGVWDELLEGALPLARRPGAVSIYWDVDAPATVARLQANAGDPLHRALKSYDAVFTYGGGEAIVRGYLALGARSCTPVYNALDPDTHFPVPAEARFKCDLGLLANRLPDREERVEKFFCLPARRLPDKQFLLAGNGWESKPFPSNLTWIGHLYTASHNPFNSSPTAVLNVARDSMAEVGWSPATRIFEAAGAGACVITDAWRGIEDFLVPGREILVAHDADEVVHIVRTLTRDRATTIGAMARKRILEGHTYTARADQIEQLLAGRGIGATMGVSR